MGAMNTLATPMDTPVAVQPGQIGAAAATPVATVPAKPKRLRPTVPNPGKPWPDFPLTWHPRGYWQKKVGGAVWRFGAEPIGAYNDYRDRLKAYEAGEAAHAGGAIPRFTLGHAKDSFLNRQAKRLAEGEIGPVQMGKWFTELRRMLPRAVPLATRLSALADERTAPALFGAIRSAAMARGLHAADRHICYVRAMLDHVSSPAGGRMMRPPCYGGDFEKPTREQMERDRNARQDEGPTTWSRAEAVRLIRAAAEKRGPHLYAQLVLAVVAGYTSADLARLPISRVKRDLGVIDFPRVKNGRKRLCLLSGPLLAAIDASLGARPKPREERFAHLLFLSRRGTPINESKPKLDGRGRTVGTGRKDNLGLSVRRLCETLDRDDEAAWRRGGKKGIRPAPLKRAGCGQKTFRSLNYGACVRSGVDKDFIALLRGRRFQNPIEEYYLRGDLRDEMSKLVNHLIASFEIPDGPPARLKQSWPKKRKDGKTRLPMSPPSRRTGVALPLLGSPEQGLG